MKRNTLENFILKAREIHGWKYDYSKVNYVNSRTKVCIICPEHGEFWQTPNMHLSGNGCPFCFNEYKRGQKKKLTKFDFIERSKKIHGDKYDYSKVNYVNTTTKVCIICPEHGEFWQTPNDHMSGKECKKCVHRSYKKNTEEFIEDARKVHGDKYDYSKVEYINNCIKVCIICPEHGEFWQSPKMHLNGNNCPFCSNKLNGIKKRLNYETFIKKAYDIHGDKYDYSKVEYLTTDDKITIICPIHGEFIQRPHNHLRGQGCPKCNESFLEKEITNFLINKNIVFVKQKTFDWLKYKKNLYLDFYLPEYNIAIECQGEQHFKPFRWEKNESFLNERKNRDNIKKKLCEEHNIKIKYFSYTKFNNDIITNKNDLIK